MPAPLSITPSLSPTPASTPLGAGLSIMGAGSGLFGNILKLDNTTPIVSEPLANMTLTGNNRFSLDPAMLALPQELSSLSPEDLQALLTKFKNVEEGTLDNQILQSLTVGIPSKEILGNTKARNEWGCILTLNPEYSNMPTPVDDDNVLLSASGLIPSTMEEFKFAIKSGTKDNTTLESKLSDETIESLTNGNEQFMPIIMINFISPPPLPSTIDINDFEFDASTFSSLTKLAQPTANNSNIFGDEIDFDGEMNPLLTMNKSGASEVGFQGSLLSLSQKTDDDKSIKAIVSDVSGQLSASAFNHSLGNILSQFSESSLLTADGNLLGSYHLSPNTNPLFTSSTATGSHPATHLVAMMIEKAATGSDKAKQELSVQLDPPELGRMQIHLSMEKGEAMKVHLIAEKQETLTLLQRDSHILKSALDSAGIQTDSSSLSFDLSSNNQSFNQLLGGNQQDGQTSKNIHFAVNNNGSILSDKEITMIESRMNFIPDKITGNIHYSLLV